MDLDAAQQYRERWMDSVRGWLHPLDAKVLCLLAEYQHDHGHHGDLLEIGAFEGKTAILLGYLTSEPDRIVVSDIFGEPSAKIDEWYRGLSRDVFQANFLRFHPRLPVVHQGPSSALADLEQAGRFRMVHVDGSHRFDDVHADAAIARTMLDESGIVIFDDYRGAHVPGVAAAVWDEVISGRLHPFCLTENKLYGTWSGATAEVIDRLRSRLAGEPTLYLAEEEVLGHRMLLALPPAYRVPNGSLPARVARRALPPALADLARRLRDVLGQRGPNPFGAARSAASSPPPSEPLRYR